eukprot:TRINITY_DN6668_c0_g1_i1.p1 TRINITY_DN6668_c0_g1~~TRINITY_DN6668_c0_g1_i1.p1  ORF type:complete len:157 (-),score=10.88 TRINITY_DN6668_c0_g1_i1:60-530(-)
MFATLKEYIRKINLLSQNAMNPGIHYSLSQRPRMICHYYPSYLQSLNAQVVLPYPYAIQPIDPVPKRNSTSLTEENYILSKMLFPKRHDTGGRTEGDHEYNTFIRQELEPLKNFILSQKSIGNRDTSRRNEFETLPPGPLSNSIPQNQDNLSLIHI